MTQTGIGWVGDDVHLGPGYVALDELHGQEPSESHRIRGVVRGGKELKVDWLAGGRG